MYCFWSASTRCLAQYWNHIGHRRKDHHPRLTTRYSSQVCQRWRKVALGYSTLGVGLYITSKIPFLGLTNSSGEGILQNRAPSLKYFHLIASSIQRCSLEPFFPTTLLVCVDFISVVVLSISLHLLFRTSRSSQLQALPLGRQRSMFGSVFWEICHSYAGSVLLRLFPARFQHVLFPTSHASPSMAISAIAWHWSTTSPILPCTC